jgi:hypothetical protein
MDRNERIREEFRHHYHTRHGIRLDDEVVIILLRVAFMHRDLKRELRSRPVLQFRSGRDYLLYGVGRLAGLSIPFLLACIMIALLVRRA